MQSSNPNPLGLLVVIIFALAIATLLVCIWGTIFKKAGYSFWMALLMFLPLVNLIWLLVFAFSKWPIHREMDQLRSRLGYGTGFPVAPAPPQQ